MPKTNYDLVAAEYYTPNRRTSRNFDAATHNALAALDIAPTTSDVYLEVGAGRGRTQEFVGRDATVIHFDLSMAMLKHKPREPSIARVRADASSLPVRSASTDFVSSWLFDPFNCPSFYYEVARILCVGGYFVGSLPSSLWGRVARTELGLPLDRTEFITDRFGKVGVQSLLSGVPELNHRCRSAGLSPLSIVHGFLEESAADISPDVEIVARALGNSVYDVPLVVVLVARREENVGI
jgi:hypothetical protein